MDSESIEAYLYRLLGIVNRKRQQFDQACQTCHTLLHPRPKELDALEQEESKQKHNIQSSEDLMDPKDEAEIKLVNDILTKATKARSKLKHKSLDAIQSKSKSEYDIPAANQSNLSDDQKSPYDVQSETKSEYDISAPNLSKMSNDQKSPNDVQCKSKSEYICAASLCKTLHIKKDVPKKFSSAKSSQEIMSVVSETDIILKNSKKPTHSHKEIITRKSGKIVHKNEIPHVTQSVVSLQDRVQQPSLIRKSDLKKHFHHSKNHSSVQTQRTDLHPKSSHSRVRPAHMVAPFKTNTNLHFPRRHVSKSVASERSNSQDCLQVSNIQDKLVPLIQSTTTVQTETSGKCHSQNESKVQNCEQYICPQLKESSQTEDIVPCKISEPLCQEVSDYSKLSSTHISENSKDRAQQHVIDSSLDGKEYRKMYCLHSDCFNINIPLKFRRICTQNQQLQNKMKQKSFLKIKKGGMSFIKKLQEVLDTDEELLYRKRAFDCLHSHHRLFLILDGLKLDHLSEMSPAKDIFWGKLVSEFVLSAFSALSGEFSELSKVKFKRNLASKEVLSNFTRKNLPYVWMPSDLTSNKLLYPRVLLHYSSVQELKQYADLLLQLQNLQYHWHLSDMWVSNSLHWLDGDSEQVDFSLFRGLHSLMTSNGEYFPALILQTEE